MRLTLTSLLILLFSAATATLYWRFSSPRSLTFSDSARFADVARSVLQGQGPLLHHTYYHLDSLRLEPFVPIAQFHQAQLPIRLLVGIFRFLPLTDSSLMLLGVVVFSLCALLIFLLGSRLHSPAAGAIAAFLFVSNLNFLEYAANFATEIMLVLEILLVGLCLTLSGKKQLLMVIPLLAMFYTRPQAILVVVAVGAALMWSFLKRRYRPFRAAVAFGAVALVVLLLADVVVSFSLKYHALFNFPHYGALLIPANTSQARFLRGDSLPLTNHPTLTFASKVFYNTYNFLKDSNRLAPVPVIWGFLLGLFFLGGSRLSLFKPLAFFTLVLFLAAAAATLPNSRYVHPAIPLILLVFAIFLLHITRPLAVHARILAVVLTLAFITLPVWGHLTLDYRFRRRVLNYGSPPVYQKISDILAQNIPPGHLIITNLDAWAAWYHGLSTMWFPLSPDYLMPNAEVSFAPPEYIAISNLLAADTDFALGEWSQVVDDPNHLTHPYLVANYRLLTTFDISPQEVYENKPYRGAILVRK